MKVAHYWDKLRTVGGYRFLKAASARFAQKRFVTGMRERAYQRTAHTQWLSRFQKVLARKEALFLSSMLEGNRLLTLADRFALNYFDLLGSDLQQLNPIPWHTDFRLQVRDIDADCAFDSDLFYADITISSSSDARIQKDIKVPWELSRFHQLPVLGEAYIQTGSESYAQAAKTQIESWLENNPYLLGVNWMNSMEVGVRACNWIVGWRSLKPFFIKDEPFSERFICTLWDHLMFIEHNWEWYDGRTSNHYLSNLVGYAYLCQFFNEKNRWQHCFSELKRELAWQVFDEGTSYEGSTRYHQLVTELFLHGFLVADQMGEPIEQSTVNKLDQMISFTERCTPNGQGEPVALGDDDSGSLFKRGLYSQRSLHSEIGTSTESPEPMGTFTYPKFGVSIIKSPTWHATLRYHAYDVRQPSGHFHQDVGSVTVSYNGIPIVVDPGSYLYTASTHWRNRFRAMENHSSFYPQENKHFLGNDLFSLDLSPGKQRQSRNFSIEDDLLIIRDLVPRFFEWQLIFGPHIELERNEKSWIIRHKNIQVLKMRSEMSLSISSAFYSPNYGVIQKVWKLVGKVNSTESIITTFEHFPQLDE